MDALLLPDDMEESGERKDMARSVSITTSDSGKDEAVELCRQDSNDYNKDKAAITLSPSQDLDEEENILLLDEIRKDVIRTHPDLRFFLGEISLSFALASSSLFATLLLNFSLTLLNQHLIILFRA
jgi:hypothetical protein